MLPKLLNQKASAYPAVLDDLGTRSEADPRRMGLSMLGEGGETASETASMAGAGDRAVAFSLGKTPMNVEAQHGTRREIARLSGRSLLV